MKPTKSNHIVLALALLTCLSAFNSQFSTAFAQGTAFSYQGRLNSSGSPANGSYDFRFKLYSDPLGNTQVGASYLTNAIPVTAGLFITTIDFGAGIFTGSNYWLEVDVKTNNAGSYTVLSPLQVVTPTPYAIMANTASNLLGTLPVAQLSAGTANISISGNATTATTANNFSGSLSGDVTGTQGATTVASVGGQSAANVAGGASAANAATSAATANTIVKRDASGNFSASTVTANLAGNATTATSATTATTANNFSGSLSGDVTGTQGATAVANVGGQTAANVASGAIAANAATSANTANTIVKRDGSGNFTSTSITLNGITLNGNLYLPSIWSGATIFYAGDKTLLIIDGHPNFFAGPSAGNLTMSGGPNMGVGYQALFNNTSGGGNTANGYRALYSNTSGGNNTANGGMALYSNTEGSENIALGDYAGFSNTEGSENIALGNFAGYDIAGNNNIDIGNWGDSTDNNIIRIGTSQTATYLAGTVYANGVALTSDRNAKENFTAVNAREVLAKVASLPVTEWNYRTDNKEVQHIGPMAQDFQAAFGLAGMDDKHISVLDEGGVALAAIQGLNLKLNEKDAEIQDLQARLEKLEQVLKTRNGGGK